MTRTIVLSYGLKRRTTEALDRARRYGHEIHLVPAIPMATRGLRRHRSALVTVHDEIGRAGLAAALGQDPAELVLLLHEDVLLHPDAAARLLEVADQRASVAVPATNHPDVDGATGTLPPDVVQPLGELAEPVPVERYRAACLAATAGRLHRMLRFRLTAATTRLYSADGALLVREAVATDLDEAADQLEEPTGPDGRPLLVAAMIVRDEEHFLPGCLDSLDGLVDRVEVCDTGSTDRTVAIAEDAGAHVTHASWRNDFAWARNQVLEECRDAWFVLQVDADERVRVDDPEAFRRFLATALHDSDGFDVPLRDVAADGTELGGQQLPRIFPARGTSYHGRVHEVARYEGNQLLPWTVTTELEIEHHGYQPAVIEARDKHARNLALARADFDEDPTPVARLQLARSLALEPETIDETLELVGGLYDEMQAGTDGLNETGHIPTYQLYAQALFDTGEEDRAWEVLSRAVEHYPYSTLLRAMYFDFGRRLGRYDEVTTFASEAGEGEAARPWENPVAQGVEAVQLALSQLAVDDVAGAGETITALLERGVPAKLGHWGQIVSVVALTRPDHVVDLLLPAAAENRDGQALQAVGVTFDPTDAAGFAIDVVAHARETTDDQRRVAIELVARVDDPDLLTALAAALEESPEAVFADVRVPGDRLRIWHRTLDAPIGDVEPFDAVLARLAAGEQVEPEAAGRSIAADMSGTAMRDLSRALPPDVAAPIAAAAVSAGAATTDEVRTALAVCTLADDAASAAALGDAIAVLDESLLQVLLERANGRGARSMVRFLTNTLLRRS